MTEQKRDELFAPKDEFKVVQIKESEKEKQQGLREVDALNALDKQLELEMGRFSHRLPDINTEDRWNKLLNRLARMHDIAGGDWKYHVLDMSKRAYSGDEYLDVRSRQFAEMLLITDLLDQHSKMAARYGFLPEFLPVRQGIEFVTARGVTFLIDGVCVRDFVDAESNKKPHELFNFVVEAATSPYEADTRSKHQLNNPSEYYHQFPSHAKEDIGVYGSAFGLVMHSVGPMLDSSSVNFTPEQKEIYSWGKKLFGTIEARKKEIYEVLFNPQHTDYSSLQERMNYFLAPDNYYRRVFALYALITTEEDLRTIYRRSQAYTRQGIEVDYYENIMRALSDFLEVMPGVKSVSMEDYLPALLADSDQIETQPPQIEDLRKTASAIFTLSTEKKYPIEVNNVNWVALTPPQEAFVSFDANRPVDRFYVSLKYKTADEDDDLDLDLSFDTKKKTFDWSFLDSPDTQDANALKNVIFTAVGQVLMSIHTRVEQEKRIKKAFQYVPQQPLLSRKEEKEYVPDLWRKKIKQAEAVEAKPSLRLSIDLLQNAKERAEEHIYDEIDIPSDEELEEVLKKIAFYDKDKIKDGLRNFNERGVGVLKKKVKMDKDGDVVWGLRIGTQVSGGARVIVTTSEAKDNKRHFRIKRILYRKDAYRETGI